MNTQALLGATRSRQNAMRVEVPAEAAAAVSLGPQASAVTESVPRADHRISLAIPRTLQWRSVQGAVARTVSPTAAERADSQVVAAAAVTAA